MNIPGVVKTNPSGLECNCQLTYYSKEFKEISFAAEQLDIYKAPYEVKKGSGPQYGKVAIFIPQ